MIIEVITLVIILLLCVYILLSVSTVKNITNISQRRTFALLIIWIIAWVITILLTDIFYSSLSFTLWTSRLSFTSSALIAYCYYLFVKEYRGGLKSNVGKFVWGLITAFFIFASLTDLVIKNVVIVNGSLKSEGGLLYPLFAVFTGIFFVYSATFFYRAYKNEKNLVSKTQMLYIFVGSAISITFTFATNLLMPMLGFREIRALGPWGLSFFIIATYYSIIRYRFLSTKLLLSRFVFTVILAIVPYSIFHLVIYIQNVTWGSVYNIGALISGYIYSVLFIYIFVFATQRTEKLIRRIFYNSKIDPQIEKNKLVKKYDTLLDINKVLEETRNLLSNVFNTKVGLIIISKGSILKNYDFLNSYKITDDDLKILGDVTLPVLRDERIYLSNKSQGITKMFSNMGIQCLFPLDVIRNMKWKIYFFLGDKKDSSNYSIQDIDYIHSIITLLSVALQRAYLHHEVLKFNKTLQEKINKATRELTNKVDELEEARKKENDMIDIMGHELRTPATVVKMNIGLLEGWRKKIEEKIKDMKNLNDFDIYTKRIRESIDNEIKIINVLLASAKLKGNRLELYKAPINVINAIELGIEGQKEKALVKGLRLVFEKPSNSHNYPLILADKGRFQEIIDNLISNAVKYTEKGSVTVSLSNDGFFVKISVKDTGRGISKEDLPNLGKKFYRTNQYLGDKYSGSTQLVRPGGTGLGLFVVFGLVRAHGGEMKVASRLGVGSTFSFTIPIAKGATKEVDRDVFSGNQFERIKMQEEENKVVKKDSGKSLEELMAEDSK